MPVRVLTLVAGSALIALATAVAAISTTRGLDAWIPALLGIPLVVCGLVALKAAARAAAVHLALVVGLIGAMVSLAKLVDSITDVGFSGLEALSLLATFVISTLYLVLGARSFVRARRARRRAAA